MALIGRINRLRKRLPPAGQPLRVVWYDPETGTCSWALMLSADRKESVCLDPAEITAELRREMALNPQKTP